MIFHFYRRWKAHRRLAKTFVVDTLVMSALDFDDNYSTDVRMIAFRTHFDDNTIIAVLTRLHLYGWVVSAPDYAAMIRNPQSARRKYGLTSSGRAECQKRLGL